MDKDLTFLQYYSNNEDLLALDYIIRRNKHGRRTEALLYKLTYKSNYLDNLAIMWKDIEELMLYGGNTIMNKFRRGHGVPYRVVLMDVCNLIQVKYNKYDSVDKIEATLLQNILIMSLNNLPHKLLQDMLTEIKISHQKFTMHEMISVLKIAIEKGYFPVHRIAEIVDKEIFMTLVERRVAYATIAALNCWKYALIGPLGWIISTVLAAIAITGPAYRVTFPAVVKIATLRSKVNYETGKSDSYEGEVNQLFGESNV